MSEEKKEETKSETKEAKEESPLFKQWVSIPPEFEIIKPEEQQLLNYASEGNLKGIKKMINNVKNLDPRSLLLNQLVNTTDEKGWTPLMLAIDSNNADCVLALYKAGARTDTRVTVDVPLQHLIGKGQTSYVVNALMYAVIAFCRGSADGSTDFNCVRNLFARRTGSSVNTTNKDQTERNYLVNVQSNTGTGSEDFSALTFAIMFANKEKDVSEQLLGLIKLLLKNGKVRIRTQDFYNFNLQHTKVLKLLLDQVSNDLFTVLVEISDTPYLPKAIELKHVKKYMPVDSEKLKASANLLIDHFNDEKLNTQRRKLANKEDEEDENDENVARWEEYIRNAASWFFYNAIRYQVAEIVEVCIDRGVRFLEGRDISMSRKAVVYSNNIVKKDGRYRIINQPASLSISWDILRQLVDYAITLGEDIQLTDKFITRIVQGADFLVDANVDVDVLTAFGVRDDICDFGEYNYESKITEVQARNLDFAIKHGFDLFPLKSASILIRVNNQKEFNKAFFFMKISSVMKNSSVIIDLGGGDYDLPDSSILIQQFYVYKQIQNNARIQNGRVVDADGNDVDYVSSETLPFEKGDIVNIKQEENILSGELKHIPSKRNGWYSLVGHGKKIRAQKEDVSFCDIPAAHVIMNATIRMLNMSTFDNMDIDDLDFTDDYWNSQTAETLARDYDGENVISKLLVHPWTRGDGYTDGDIYNIFEQFVELGAYISPNFGKTMLKNASDYDVSVGINDGADIYDLLRENCPEYTFGEKEQIEFSRFLDRPRRGGVGLFNYVLEVENSGKETFFPMLPIYIPKICDIVNAGKKDYEKDAYLAKFLNFVGSRNTDSEVVVDCVKKMLAKKTFDINYNQNFDYQIPLVHVLKNGNELVLDIFLADKNLDVNQNIDTFAHKTALEWLLLTLRYNRNTESLASQTRLDIVRIMINKLLQNSRVECPFRQHTLRATQVDAAPEIIDFLLQRKYYENDNMYPSSKDPEWYFDPNTVPLYEMRDQEDWEKKLQEQGIEPDWLRVTDEYTKTVQSDLSVAYKVVKWRGLALQHIPKKLMNHLLCFLAITSDGLAFEFIPIDYKMSWDMVVKAIKQNWRAFQFLPEKAYYERIQEVNIEKNGDIQKFLKEMYGKNGAERAEQLFNDSARGLGVDDYSEGDLKLLFSLDFNGQTFGLDELAKKTFDIMKKIDADVKKSDYVYRGLPSKSEHEFLRDVVRRLFDSGGPHEGEWSAFKNMFPKAAAYAEYNQDTPEGKKEIEKEKSEEWKEIEARQKEIEKDMIRQLHQAVNAELEEKVEILHWDDFRPPMF